ncbi:hypothetical protein CDAR_606262 [Caerostris darwini]|nr:hypothetical protein CDAR_606262 [Caerostris darwini]
MCSDTCFSHAKQSKELADEINISKWRIDSEEDKNICMNAEKYVKENSLQQKYGKINNIFLSKNNLLEDLYKTSYIKHLVSDHMSEVPDFILHIASHRYSTQIFKSGILLEMLEKICSTQFYIFSQDVLHKESECINDFTHAYKLEIEKAMEHKYGANSISDETCINRIKSLIDTAIKFDFLKVNHNSFLNLKFPCNHESEKNCGIFVQYNFARLSNIFKNFEIKVKEGYYNPLQPLHEVDFTLLKLDEEWNLFHFVISFPQLVQNIFESLFPSENMKTRHCFNKICVMLQELCRYLSLYYSKIRILSGPQVHLQKIMNARLWLLKGIHQVFQNSFSLLNIQGLDQM